MIQKHMQGRAKLQCRITEERERQARQREELQRDLERYQRMLSMQQRPPTRSRPMGYER